MKPTLVYLMVACLTTQLVGCEANKTPEGDVKPWPTPLGSMTVEYSDLPLTSPGPWSWQANLSAEQDMFAAAAGEELYYYWLGVGAGSQDSTKGVGVNIRVSSLDAIQQGDSVALVDTEPNGELYQAVARIDETYYRSHQGSFTISALEAGRITARLDATLTRSDDSEEARIVAVFEGPFSVGCAFIHLEEGTTYGIGEDVGLEDPRCASLFE